MPSNSVFTNFKNFNDAFDNSTSLIHVFANEKHNFLTAWNIFLRAKKDDIVILNIDQNRLLKLCVLRIILPFKKFKLVSVDILLRKPTTVKQKFLAKIKTILFKKVDIFVLYFRNTSGYEKYFKIRKEKFRYVPFKVNSWEHIFYNYLANPKSGNYILCAGQTLRDLKTFIDASRISRLPSVLLTPGNKALNDHGTPLINEGLPPNLSVELHNDGREETYLDWIKKAAIVVIPRFSSDISSTGISTYLCSMAAWRCVILSKGPGADDLLTNDQAILVDPENVEQLASAIIHAWNDKNLRKHIGLHGRHYAEMLQGEKRLLKDIYNLTCLS